MTKGGREVKKVNICVEVPLIYLIEAVVHRSKPTPSSVLEVACEVRSLLDVNLPFVKLGEVTDALNPAVEEGRIATIEMGIVTGYYCPATSRCEHPFVLPD